MKHTLIAIISAGLISAAALVGFSPLLASTADASSARTEVLNGANATGQSGSRSLEQSINDVTNVLLFVIGAIAVIVIIYGGIKFVTSDGDASKIKGARETILYAVVGIVIALIAYAIVRWVVRAFAA